MAMSPTDIESSVPPVALPGLLRRDLGLAAAAALVMGQAAPAAAQAARPKIAMLVYPGMIMLDLVGPLTVFNILGADIHLTAPDLKPVATDVGIPLAPNTVFADVPPKLDVLFVPGGLGGTVAAMGDPAVLAFLADRGAAATWVTSVCTGSLLLGAAGLLRGYSATSHWYVRDLLGSLGAKPSAERVVVDRNRVTGGGVTAGIDFGLRLAALMTEDAVAERIQLLLEYHPKPPFNAGEPEEAGPVLTQAVLKARAPALSAARDAVALAQKRLGS